MFYQSCLKFALIGILSSIVALPAAGQMRISGVSLASVSGMTSGGSYTAAVSGGQPAMGTSGRISFGFLPSQIAIVSTPIESRLDGEILPAVFRLAQNYPNPFFSTTVIRFDLPSSERVLLEVFDLMGRKISTIVNNTLKAGSHQVVWQVSDLPSGIYFYRLESESHTASKSMVLLR